MSFTTHYVMFCVTKMNNIRKEDLIDINENKPIDNVEVDETTDAVANEVDNQAVSNVKTVMEIPLKNISKLTNEEKAYLINEAKNGIDNKFYKVSFCKNGNTKITKRKVPKQSMSEKIISNNTSNYSKQAPTMSNEQLLFEHVINLESQIATLRQKHKNLKKSYKQIYQDVYIDDDEDQTQTQVDISQTNNELQDNTVDTNNSLQHEMGTDKVCSFQGTDKVCSFQGTNNNSQHEMVSNEIDTHIPPNNGLQRSIPRMRTGGWRQRLMNRL